MSEPDSYDVCPDCKGQPEHWRRDTPTCPTCKGVRVATHDQIRSFHAKATKNAFLAYGNPGYGELAGKTTKVDENQYQVDGEDGARIRYGWSEAGHFVIHSPDKALYEEMPGMQPGDRSGLASVHRVRDRVLALRKGK